MFSLRHSQLATQKMDLRWTFMIANGSKVLRIMLEFREVCSHQVSNSSKELFTQAAAV